MQPQKILFLGTHGQHNIGDELLLETFLAQLGSQHHYFINSYNPDFTAQQLAGRYQVEVFDTSRRRWHLPALILESDLLFFGGGSIIKELYQSVGRNRYATLLMILMIVTFANLIGRKKIIMSNIGVGPLTSRTGHFLARLILRQVDFVAVRDMQSYQTCLKLGLHPEQLSLVPDPVFIHPPAYFGTQNPSPAQAESGPLKIALNLNFDIENPANWDTFIDGLARSFNDLHRQHPLEIHALPMQSAFKANDDLSVLLGFFAKKTPNIPKVIHVPTTPTDVAQIITNCDVVVAERFHALVMAAILQKPYLALMYDVKVRELVKQLGMEHFALDINQSFNPLQFTGMLLALSRSEHRPAGSQNVPVARLRRHATEYFAELTQLLSGAYQSETPNLSMAEAVTHRG